MKSIIACFSFLLILTILLPLVATLFYPASSVLQLTASVSVPVEEYFPERRIIVDWCFQMNYDLPYNVSSFYNIPIWPGKYSHRYRRQDQGLQLKLNKFSHKKERAIWNSNGYKKYHGNAEMHKKRHPNDFTAGEFYQALEDIFVSYGIHETCLLSSVCDLAQHPFDKLHRNIMTEALTYILTPSIHQAFSTSEEIYRQVYEAAEQRGFMGDDCGEIFPECRHDILGSITEVLYDT